MLALDLDYRRGSFELLVRANLDAAVNGVSGPSGSGKSTLLGLIAGLLRPTRGRLELDGDVLVDTARGVFVAPWQRHIGVVFQDGQLFPHMSVRRNLLYGFSQLAPAQRRFQLPAITELLELEPLLERRPALLSGGERQRVALGRALLYSPRLLLLDEPLASLDERLKQQILPFLARIRDETRIPMLYVSHAPAEVEYLADRRYEMRNGRLSPMES